MAGPVVAAGSPVGRPGTRAGWWPWVRAVVGVGVLVLLLDRLGTAAAVVALRTIGATEVTAALVELVPLLVLALLSTALPIGFAAGGPARRWPPVRSRWPAPAPSRAWPPGWCTGY